MYITHQPIILASGSPRRQEFLRWLGLDYTIETANINESLKEKESPQKYVLRLAKEKGEAVATDFPESYIISGDTTVCLDDTIFGKPENPEAAVAMLMQLSGRTHTVLSAYSVINKTKKHYHCKIVSTTVTFIPFSEEIACAYVASGEPLDKAGAYGIQRCGVSLVEKIDGSYSNVVGLPLAEVMEVLLAWGVASPHPNFSETERKIEYKMNIL